MNQKEIEKDIFEPIIKIIYEFITNENGININNSHINLSNNITLLDDTIYFKICDNDLDIVFGIWYEQSLQSHLMHKLNFGEILAHEEVELKLDTAKEVGNIIFGNAINHFAPQYHNSTLSTPIILEKEIVLSSTHIDKYQTIQSTYNTDFGDMTISIIHPKNMIFHK